MARRRKLNIRHHASDNEGIQSTSNNTNSTNVEGSNVAETRSSPCHAEGVIQVEPKRARGPTKMLDVWEMEHGDLIIVNLDKYGRPIGEEGTTLTRFIGSVARRYQYAPINYKSWKVMPNDYKEEMLKLIEIKKGKGVLPGRKEIYIDTRTRKDGTIVNEKAAKLIEELKKHNNEAGTSQSTQDTQGSMSWKDDIFYQVQGPDKNGRVRCMGKIPHSKKSKVCASENEELRERVKNMENLLANVMTLIQNRFSGADVNDIIQAARQVPDATSAQNHLNSLSPNNNENNENGED
ncbi:uncharacterized protein [Cicer arietinum]|uniref:uncharacterized protein isoform X3 n=1 Tax=Cicer arietinum TaxID=3827 RepID=UPI003CC5EF1E